MVASRTTRHDPGHEARSGFHGTLRAVRGSVLLGCAALVAIALSTTSCAPRIAPATPGTPPEPAQPAASPSAAPTGPTAPTAVAETSTAPEPDALPPGIEQEKLPHPNHPERRVELYWTAPTEGDGPWPAILFIHGHQFPERPGARRYVDRGTLLRRAAQGFVAAGVSQPGYGASDGPPDFCGPRSHAAVHAALARLRELPEVDPGRIVVSGYSRGAAVAAMVAARDDTLAGAILGAGVYDFAAAYAWLDDSDRTQAGIRRNIDRETGSTPEAFRERSAVYADPPIRIPVIILHGEEDRNVPVAQATALAERLTEVGTEFELYLFESVEHGIPRELYDPPVERFLERWVLGGEEADQELKSAAGG